MRLGEPLTNNDSTDAWPVWINYTGGETFLSVRVTGRARASGVTAVVDAAAAPYLVSARETLRDGYVAGGTRRILDWVRPHACVTAVRTL